MQERKHQRAVTYIENGWVIRKLLLRLRLCLLFDTQVLYIAATEDDVFEDILTGWNLLCWILCATFRTK
jgi:hypothetical protein